LSGGADIEFVTALFPYTQLLEVMEMCNYCDQHVADETGFVVAGIDEANNRVVVGLREVTEEKVALFREKIADSACISFEEYPVILVSKENG